VEKFVKKPAGDPRRKKLLDAAFVVFLRYGFRKTSMDEVARAAEVSRQGLYLHFATKEDLFRATLEHAVDKALEEATAALEADGEPLEERLVAAFDAWVGRYVGMLGASATDLGEASGTLGAEIIKRGDAAFLAVLARALKGSALMPVYRAVGLTAPKLADTLYATARGFKYASPSREAFSENMGVAIRMLCTPIKGGS
jgi:AcrR family transcriptional regulator